MKKDLENHKNSNFRKWISDVMKIIVGVYVGGGLLVITTVVLINLFYYYFYFNK